MKSSGNQKPLNINKIIQNPSDYVDVGKKLKQGQRRRSTIIEDVREVQSPEDKSDGGGASAYSIEKKVKVNQLHLQDLLPAVDEDSIQDLSPSEDYRPKKDKTVSGEKKTKKSQAKK